MAKEEEFVLFEDRRSWGDDGLIYNVCVGFLLVGVGLILLLVETCAFLLGILGPPA